MNAITPSPLLGRGVYPLKEAARLVQLPVQTAARWADGNHYTYHGEARRSLGLVPFELPPLQGQRDITFLELLTLRMVRTFRNAGLGLPLIKRVAAKAAEDFGGSTPLATKRFRTDGRRIFVELKSEAPANDEPAASRAERHLIDVLSGQEQFAQVVEPSLFQNLDWDEDIATRWWPRGRDAGVVLDPAVLFGAPKLGNTRLPTAAIAQAVRAEGGGEAAIGAVADWHAITAEEVRQAVVFETEWLTAV